jgi:hypothetical protein
MLLLADIHIHSNTFKLFIIPDPCHVIKNVKNSLTNKHSFNFRDKTLQKYQLTNSTVSIDVLELLLKFDAKCKIFNPKYPSTHVI